MKKLFIMVLAAIFAANISAQEVKSEKAEKAEVKAEKAEVKAEKAECRKGNKECKKSFEERTEADIKTLSDELYLDSLQAEKFAKTYRDYRKAQLELRKDFKAKFAKVLNERQAEKVLRFRSGHPCKAEGYHKGEGPHKGDFQRKHDRKK